jgi:hypothetical protein
MDVTREASTSIPGAVVDRGVSWRLEGIKDLSQRSIYELFLCRQWLISREKIFRN